jgi:hypothetical protein
MHCTAVLFFSNRYKGYPAGLMNTLRDCSIWSLRRDLNGFELLQVDPYYNTKFFEITDNTRTHCSAFTYRATGLNKVLWVGMHTSFIFLICTLYYLAQLSYWPWGSLRKDRNRLLQSSASDRYHISRSNKLSFHVKVKLSLWLTN